MRYRDDAISVEWVSDNAALAAACASVADVVTLDTEFMRTNTYYPVPALYQMGVDDQVFLIDPTVIDEWQPFVDILEDARVFKVMHACLEDLELLFHHLGAVLKSVFDTQYANAFLTDRFSLSYAGLVDARLGVALSKHETRSNWLQRPLSEKQIEYAVEDVIYLRPLFEALREELAVRDRLTWFEEDMLVRQRYQPVDPDTCYLSQKRVGRLQGRQLAAFKNLCSWREETAQAEDVPRSRVIWDEHLFAFARTHPLTEADIKAALPGKVARRYAHAIVTASRVTLQEELPSVPKPLTSAQGALVKSLRAVGLAKAETLRMAPELLCRKRDLEHCVREHQQFRRLPEVFSSWRNGVVGELYLEILNDALSVGRPSAGG